MKKLNQIGFSLLALATAAPAFAAEGQGLTTIVADDNQLEIGTVLANITTWVLGFSAAVAVLFLIVGGLQYITASGNQKRIDAAKATLLYAVIGLVVILLAFVIVGFLRVNLTNVVNQ